MDKKMEQETETGVLLCMALFLRILLDPKYTKLWETWHYTLLRSCRIFQYRQHVYSSFGRLLLFLETE